MSSSGGVVGKVVAGFVGLALVAGMLVAFRFSQKRGLGAEAETEAKGELVRFADGIARCAVTKHELPETGKRVPSRLAEVSGKKYLNALKDWDDPSFECAGFQADAPQLLQYRWRKLKTGIGRVEARADLDADGKPDKWFEIEVRCERPNACGAVNYVSEVSEDGVRQPPYILSWLGRAPKFIGEPPSLSAEDEPPPPPPSATPPPKPLAVVTAGTPAGLDTLYLEAERRAALKLSGAILLTLEYKNTRGPMANPAEGTTLEGVYGRQDNTGLVHKGEQVVRVTFNQQGLTEKLEKAPRDLHGLGFSECQPEKLLAAVAASTPGALDLSLAWSAKHERALWSVKQAKKAVRTFGADRCALVK